MGAVVVVVRRLALGGFDTTLNGRRGSKADVGCRWAVCRGCGRRRWHGGCWLKKRRHKDVTLASCSTRT